MITASIQTLLTSAPALAAIVGDRIRVIGPGPTPQVPFLLHGAVETRPRATHDGIGAFEHDYQVLGYFHLQSQAQQCAQALAMALEGAHGSWSAVVTRAALDYDGELKLHTLQLEARIFEK